MVTVTERTDGTMDLFVRGSDGTPWHQQLGVYGQVLRYWELMSNGHVLGAPSGIYNGTTSLLDVFAVGTDTLIYEATGPYGTAGWSGWNPVPGNGHAA
jgi:hypothetical protein